ncbi:Hsp20/alpha crystallin family protein [Mesobacillus maritimus]|uniref:Hsp20/alpha crystallin family protein n=1 Tax=Mesobacillus maritimus TaxID=1643336 RepID=UPI00203B9B32|nr:Hsp20/alpha crystallin family protein [Mesobacillus maritimus]MCM3668098.1 Hsp20/alpha crystallin family protein [Mesobacillus maritimus]
MSEKSNNKNSPMNPEPFGNWFKSFQQFMNDAPVKGFLDTIDDFFRQPMFAQATFPVSVRELGDQQIVTAELPGIKKEQIGIDILGNRLTISIKQQDVYIHEDDKKKVYQHKESFQQMNRTITFPQPIDEKKVKASYRDGLLEITVPKIKGKSIDIIE